MVISGTKPSNYKITLPLQATDGLSKEGKSVNTQIKERR